MSHVRAALEHEVGTHAAIIMHRIENYQPLIDAAESLAKNLQDCGIVAAARGEICEDRPAIAVSASGDYAKVLQVLEHYAVPVALVDQRISNVLQVRTYSVRVFGQDVPLVVFHQQAQEAMPCAA